MTQYRGRPPKCVHPPGEPCVHNRARGEPTVLEKLRANTRHNPDNYVVRFTEEDVARWARWKASPVGMATDAPKYPDNPPPIPWCGNCGKPSRCGCDPELYVLPFGVEPFTPEAESVIARRRERREARAAAAAAAGGGEK